MSGAGVPDGGQGRRIERFPNHVHVVALRGLNHLRITSLACRMGQTADENHSHRRALGRDDFAVPDDSDLDRAAENTTANASQRMTDYNLLKSRLGGAATYKSRIRCYLGS